MLRVLGLMGGSLCRVGKAKEKQDEILLA